VVGGLVDAQAAAARAEQHEPDDPLVPLREREDVLPGESGRQSRRSANLGRSAGGCPRA
jgi:hypothetical protein